MTGYYDNDKDIGLQGIVRITIFRVRRPKAGLVGFMVWSWSGSYLPKAVHIARRGDNRAPELHLFHLSSLVQFRVVRSSRHSILAALSLAMSHMACQGQSSCEAVRDR